MGRCGKWIQFKMLLELPISEVLLEGKGEESAEGDERNDEGITQQLGHTSSIERHFIIELP